MNEYTIQYNEKNEHMQMQIQMNITIDNQYFMVVLNYFGI